jgi:ribonuclease E
VVEGEEGYRAARDFMKLLMPSHAKRVKPYADPVPLFQRYGAEDQLAAMYNPVVQLKSGGYIVINPTEALVSIDINSGRSTKEHGIEADRLNTNLEAARRNRPPVAPARHGRPCRDRLHRHGIRLERPQGREGDEGRAQANDRARIQVGRISSFGLMEMSRQRLRTGVLEATTRECPHCEGTGLVRTASSSALSALRLLEEEAARGNGTRLTLRASQEAAIYVLNRKRAELNEIEDRYGVLIDIVPDGETEGARMSVESSGPPPLNRPKFEPIILDDDDDVAAIEDEADEEETEERSGDESREDGEGARRKRSRRRRGRRNRRDGEDQGDQQAEGGEEGDDAEPAEVTEGESESPRAEGEEDGEPRRRGRRGRRGGRRNRGEAVTGEEGAEADVEAEGGSADDSVVAEEASVEVTPEDAPAKPKRTRRKKTDDVAEAEAAPVETAPAEPAAEDAPAKPKRTRRKKADAVAEGEAEVEAAPVETAPAEPVAEDAPAKPKRTRRKKAEAPADEAVADSAPQDPVAAEAPADSTERASASDPESVSDPDAPAEPLRRGWWQRTFGA